MRSALFALLLAYSVFANADQLWAVGTVGSHHFERKNYCEANMGVGFEYGGDTYRFVAGTYHNSLCYNSNYIGLAWSPLRFADWRVGTAFLAVTGYKVKLDRQGKFSDDAAFAPLPFVSYERKNFGANFLIVPPYDEFKGAIALQIKWKF